MSQDPGSGGGAAADGRKPTASVAERGSLRTRTANRNGTDSEGASAAGSSTDTDIKLPGVPEEEQTDASSLPAMPFSPFRAQTPLGSLLNAHAAKMQQPENRSQIQIIQTEGPIKASSNPRSSLGAPGNVGGKTCTAALLLLHRLFISPQSSICLSLCLTPILSVLFCVFLSLLDN